MTRKLTIETAGLSLDAASTMDVHLVQPKKADGPVPAVIVIHDILGFNEDTRRICQVLANGPMPLVVSAPNLYQGLGPKPICVIKTIRTLKRGSGVTFDRLRQVQAWLTTMEQVDAQKVVVVGFCLGGGFALLYAAQSDVAVVAPFYGDVPIAASDLQNLCPVVGGYGERDAIFAPQGHRLVSHLTALNIEHDVQFYPGTGHSYMNKLKGLAKVARFSPMRAEYNEAAANDSWKRVFEFLERHL